MSSSKKGQDRMRMRHPLTCAVFPFLHYKGKVGVFRKQPEHRAEKPVAVVPERFIGAIDQDRVEKTIDRGPKS